MLLGLDVLCDGRRAVVNCTRDILLKDYVTLLPAEQAVVEILETVPVDDLVMAAWRRLKESVYTIALDDFGMNDPREALTDVADIIKVDLRETSPADAGAMVKRYGPWRAPCRRKRCARHALAILGECEVRRWIRLVATPGAGQGKTTDLVRSWSAPAFANWTRRKSRTGISTCSCWGCFR
jgi:hypothetical protein